MAEIAARLREADGQRVGDRPAGDLDRLGIVLQPAHEIARGGEAQTLNLRVPGLVGEFVEEAGLGLVLELDRLAVDEGPLVGRHRLRRVRRASAHGQHRAALVLRGRLVGELEALQRAAARAGHPFLAHRLDDRLAVVGRDRCGQAEALVGARRIGIPAGPDDRPAPAHREAVADIGHRPRIVHALRAVGDVAEQHLAAAIVDLVEDAPVALRGVLGPQHEEIRRVFDHAARIARRLVDQGDALVAGRVGIDLALGDADHALIGADRRRTARRRPAARWPGFDGVITGLALGRSGRTPRRWREIELDADAVGIVEEDLPAAGARHDLLAELDLLGLERLRTPAMSVAAKAMWSKRPVSLNFLWCRAPRCPRAACAGPAGARSVRRRNRASSPGNRAAGDRRSEAQHLAIEFLGRLEVGRLDREVLQNAKRHGVLP